MSAIIVKDKCLGCRSLSKIIEFGGCNCGEINKELTMAERSWLRRHGKLSEIRKPLSYTMDEVEQPLENMRVAMQNLVNEGEKMLTVTKAVRETAQRKNRMGKRRHSKLKLEISVSKRLETSKAQLEKCKSEMLKKSDNFVVLWVLNGSLKSMQIEGWVEKRAGVK